MSLRGQIQNGTSVRQDSSKSVGRLSAGVRLFSTNAVGVERKDSRQCLAEPNFWVLLKEGALEALPQIQEDEGNGKPWR